MRFGLVSPYDGSALHSRLLGHELVPHLYPHVVQSGTGLVTSGYDPRTWVLVRQRVFSAPRSHTVERSGLRTGPVSRIPWGKLGIGGRR